MTKSQIAWLAIPIIIVLAIGLTLVAAGSEDPANGPQAFEIDLAEGESQVVNVAPAGTLTLTRTRSHLEIEGADANPGYRSRVRVAKAAGQHVVADFTGDDRRFTVAALLYEGRVRITIDQQPFTEPTTTSNTIKSPTAAASTAPPTTTVPVTTAPPTTAAPTTAPPTTAPPTTAPPTTAPPTTTTIAPPTTTTTLIPKLPDGEVTYSLGPAGSVEVTFRNGEFDEVDLDLDGGWDLEEDQVGPNRIDLLLEKGDQRVIWQAYIENGEVVINLQVIEDEG